MQKLTRVSANFFLSLATMAILSACAGERSERTRQAIGDNAWIVVEDILSGGAAGSGWTIVYVSESGNPTDIVIGEFDAAYSVNVLDSRDFVTICYNGDPVYASTAVQSFRTNKSYKFAWVRNCGAAGRPQTRQSEDNLSTR